MRTRIRPQLIHPVPVVIEQLDRSNSVFDDKARTPVRQARREGSNPNTGNRITIKAQVMYYFAGGRIGYILYDRRGVDENTDGYVVFRVKDLIRKGLASRDASGVVTYDIKRGDRIVQQGSRVVDLYITSFEDFAFCSGSNQTMLEAKFQDRGPSKHTGSL